MSTTPQILYFDIRGRAEPIRLLLEDVGAQYADKQITLEDWPEIRATTPFRRMPVYSEGELEIPESFAIMNYLGRKHDLLGEDEIARVRCDVAIEAWRDYGNRVANIFGALSNSEPARKTFVETEQPTLLADLESFYLKKPSKTPYWAGNAPTVADFAAFHLVEGIANRFPKLLSQFGALKEFHVHFSERPNIKEYLASSRRPAALFYGPNGKIFPR
jgi:glutathione S-transferase